MSRIRIFGARIVSFIIIIASNRNNRRGSSLILFCDLLGIWRGSRILPK
jgi:hypothetical protein